MGPPLAELRVDAATCGLLSKLLVSFTAVIVLTWALLHTSDGSAAAWNTSRLQGAGAATKAARTYLNRSIMPAADALRSRLPGGAGRNRTHTQGAFVCLVGPGRKGQEGLKLLLLSLAGHVLKDHPRPVLLFYADDVPPEEYTPEFINSASPPQIRHLVEVHTITFKLPEHMRLVALHDIHSVDKYPGYQMMCRWNFLEMMRHPRVRKLDYYCRLDTDSRIDRPMDVDIFDYMAERHLLYGYVKKSGERYYFAEHMWDFAADWLHTHMSKPAQALAEANGFWNEWKKGHNSSFPMIWNEIEIVNVPRFMQQDMLDFADAVDATHHLFDLRWGDSPLRTIETLLFLNWTAEAQQLDFVPYYHDKSNRWTFPSPPAVAPAPAPVRT